MALSTVLRLLAVYVSVAVNVHLGLASSPPVSLNVDWPVFMTRHDPVWHWSQRSPRSPSREFTELPPTHFSKSLFGGNAMVGFMMFQPDNRTVRIDVGRADVYDDRSQDSTPHAFLDDFVYDTPRLPIGHFLVTFGADLVEGSGRLSLWNAQAAYNVSTVAGATTRLRAWASADHELADVLVLEVEQTPQPPPRQDQQQHQHYQKQHQHQHQAPSVAWVPAQADSFWMARTVAASKNVSCRDLKQPRCYCGNHAKAGYGLCFSCPGGCNGSTAGCTLCSNYVPNPPPLGKSAVSQLGVLNVTTQRHLRGTAHSTAVLEQKLPGGIDATYFAAVSAVSKDASAADSWAVSQVSAAGTAGVERVRAAHRVWWHAFWPAGGFVTYEYTVLESLYFLMQYRFGSAARRGRAFMDLNGQ